MAGDRKGGAASRAQHGAAIYSELVVALQKARPVPAGVGSLPGSAAAGRPSGMHGIPAAAGPGAGGPHLAGQEAGAEETVLFSFPATGGTPPVARWAHAAAAVGSLLFAYGGVGQVVLDDLAVLDVDLMTWRALKPRAATPRDRPGKLHAGAMAAAGRTLWLFGGQQGRKFLRELHALDTDSMTWALAAPAGAPPAARAGHSLTAVEGAGVFLFGGQGKKLYDDLHVLLVPGACGFGANGSAHGGSAHGGSAHGGTYGLPGHGHGHGPDDAQSACSAGSAGSSGAGSGASGGGGPSAAPQCEWVELRPRGQGPSARRGHTLTYDGRGSLVLFGGSTSSSTDNGLWLFHIARREWIEIKARGAVPPPRTHHSAVLLRPGQLLIFGGCNAQGVFFQDAYLLDLAAFTWSRPAALGALPAPRYHHSCTRAGRRVVIYGGVNPRQAFDGVVLVETGSGLGGELAAAADELARMGGSAASESGASSLPGRAAFGGGAGSSMFGGGGAGARAPSAPASLAGSAAAASTSGLAAAAKRAAAAARLAAAPAATPPPAPGSAAGAGSEAPSGAPAAPGTPSVLSGDLMKLQLRDLLVKRHLEDLQIASARKVEELTAALDAQRAARRAAERELRQARLVTAEAEERAAERGRAASEAGARAARDAAEAEAARAAAAAGEAARGALERQLAEANALLDSVSRELGLLSSRHHRLQQEHASLQRAHARARAAAAAEERGRRATPPRRRGGRASSGSGSGGSGSGEEDAEALAPDGSGSGPASLEGAALLRAPSPSVGPAPGEPRCAHGAAPAGCLLCAVQTCLAATQQLLTAGAAAAAAQQPRQQQQQQQQQPAPAADAPSDAAALHVALSEARAALAASESARASAEAAASAAAAAAASSADDAAELRGALARLGGDRLALAGCSAHELRELEGRLDSAARIVRGLVVERTVSELQRRAAAAAGGGGGGGGDSSLCGLCMERRKGLAFGCGHTVCVSCGEPLAACPFCRKEVTTRIRLFAS
ncbi:hypothetical protein Rsub_04094 [Raphidocelis subcapitata]|uniref:RING-type domain-containing protein n=1 Tax=Raphidocelis subcapitata TaxID=307507 RepID=A0A2V0NUN5_9CHLO|nr:hypothetical protein Rsub_04094 [Raphidocelis subcapitata]|eukprot:GBF91354.1 hypothetical protein Rsub_04094 [Raphidocelis subcapitata]